MPKLKGSTKRQQRRNRIEANDQKKRIKHKSKRYLDIMHRNDAIYIFKTRLKNCRVDIVAPSIFYFHDKGRINEAFMSVSIQPRWGRYRNQMVINVGERLYKSVRTCVKSDDKNLHDRLIYETTFTFLQNILPGNSLDLLYTLGGNDKDTYSVTMTNSTGRVW